MTVMKKCELCGSKFECAGPLSLKGPCWCIKVKTDKESLRKLRLRAKDCVCPNCLASSSKHY